MSSIPGRSASVTRVMFKESLTFLTFVSFEARPWSQRRGASWPPRSLLCDVAEDETLRAKGGDVRTKLLLAALAGVLLFACEWADSSPIRGPDGRKDWLLVSCHGSHGGCLEEAGERCPHGYDTASDQAWQSGSVSYVNRSTSTVITGNARRGEMLIHCRQGPREEDFAIDAPPASRRAPTRPPLDLSMCMKAASHLADTAAIWAARTPERVMLDDLPAHDEFLKVCAELGDQVQLCLNASYANTHQAGCEVTFDSMPERARVRVDGLFFRD
jgi:hypothetical protein